MYDSRQNRQQQPRTRVAGAMSWLGFAAVVALTCGSGAAALTMLAGCETEKPYSPCALDGEVTKKGVCTGSTDPNRDTSTCVVKAHPQCDRSICLSYFGLAPICTQVCVADSDCGAQSTCWTYADADKTGPVQRYCLPNSVRDQAKTK